MSSETIKPPTNEKFGEIVKQFKQESMIKNDYNPNETTAEYVKYLKKPTKGGRKKSLRKTNRKRKTRRRRTNRRR
jgi:hypothetical protein